MIREPTSSVLGAWSENKTKQESGQARRPGITHQGMLEGKKQARGKETGNPTACLHFLGRTAARLFASVQRKKGRKPSSCAEIANLFEEKPSSCAEIANLFVEKAFQSRKISINRFDQMIISTQLRLQLLSCDMGSHGKVVTSSNL